MNGPSPGRKTPTSILVIAAILLAFVAFIVISASSRQRRIDEINRQTAKEVDANIERLREEQRKLDEEKIGDPK